MEIQERLASLTTAEREALRLLLRHTDVNLVARALNISTSAVDKRLQSARRKLGVTRSLDAALLLAQEEGDTGRTVQVALSPAGGTAAVPANPVPSEVGGGYWPMPFPTNGRPWNTMPIWVRLIAMVGLLLLITIAILVEVSVQTVVAQAFGR